MNINKAFPSKYLKASDLDGEDRIVTIASVAIESVGQGDNQEDKPVIYFNEVEAGLVLNKTNATAISQVLQSSDTDDWIGQKIVLFPTTVDFGGKPVEAIRVKLRAPKSQQAKAAAPSGGRRWPTQEEDDSIPI